MSETGASRLAQEVADAIARYPDVEMRLGWFGADDSVQGEHGFYGCDVAHVYFPCGHLTMGVRVCRKHGETGSACFVGDEDNTYPDVEAAIADVARHVQSRQQ